MKNVGEVRVIVENVIVSGKLPSPVDLEYTARVFPPLHYFQPQPFAVVHNPQMSYIVFRLAEPEAMIILHPSGEFICTGAESMEGALEAVRAMLGRLCEVGILDEEGASRVHPEVSNIVATARVADYVNLEKAAEALEQAHFDPESFPGVVYEVPNARAVVTVFGSGRIVITGVVSPEEAQRTAERICEVLTSTKASCRREYPVAKERLEVESPALGPSGHVDVAVVRRDDPEAAVREALSLISAEKVVTGREKVLIKPNYIAPKHPSTGVTTDTRVVGALIKFVKECGCRDIIVADGGGGSTEATFNIVGIKPVVKRHGVKLVDLNRDETLEVNIPYPLALRKMNIAKTVMESDCIINVPCLKTHELGLVSLALKNLMGVVQPHGALHRRLHENLVGLAMLLKPALNIISGIVGNERHQVHGKPVPMNLIIASTDIVATDTVAAEIMDVEPDRVRSIWLGRKHGLGVGDLRKINVLGETIDAVRRHFRPSYTPAYLPSLETIRRWRVANWDYHILSTAGVIKPEPGTKQLEI